MRVFCGRDNRAKLESFEVFALKRMILALGFGEGLVCRDTKYLNLLISLKDWD